MATMETKERVMADCRGSESGCTVTIAGSRDEVLDLAVFHAVNRHGHQDTPAFREEIRASLAPEPSSTVMAGDTAEESWRPERRV
jgi:hypothetical protein